MAWIVAVLSIVRWRVISSVICGKMRTRFMAPLWEFGVCAPRREGGGLLIHKLNKLNIITYMRAIVSRP